MRKIKIEKWQANMPEYDDDGKITGSKPAEETLLTALNVLIANKKPDEIPRGLDKFRLFNRLSKSFEKAEKEGTLELEESDYKFLKEMIEKDVPSTWGMNQNLNKAIEAFLESKEEK